MPLLHAGQINGSNLILQFTRVIDIRTAPPKSNSTRIHQAEHTNRGLHPCTSLLATETKAWLNASYALATATPSMRPALWVTSRAH